MLEVQALTGGYLSRPVVRQISLSVQAGEWLSLVGANGSGKSTVLKLISRILQPQQGVVWLDGAMIHRQPSHVVAKHLALLPQQQAIPEGLTVRQLVSLGRSPHQPWWRWELSSEDWQQVDQALVETQLDDMGNRLVEWLSGGERQRAFLALALAQNPQVLLLDEPTTYLDLRYQLQLLELLKHLNRQGLAIVTVLHDINLAARYSHQIGMMVQGTLWAMGTPASVLVRENLAKVFGIEATISQTAVGIQICPVAPISI
jgi:iron complex transport system ATP-binding protein